MQTNYTRKAGERLRLECQFEYITDKSSSFNSNDFTLYWVKNYQELLQTKKGFVHVFRKNMSTVYDNLITILNAKLNLTF